VSALTSIEGIGPQLAEALKDQGVGSVEKLLEAGRTRVSRMELAAATGIDEDRLLRFINHADLMRVKGIGGEYAELLEAAGVDTVVELAQRNADRLQQQLVTTNEERSLVRTLPAASRVRQWIAQANQLARVVQH
jgi:predicted flap endonuclease-1-like 5' DNA nuclease